jgi:hypothetical protein
MSAPAATLPLESTHPVLARLPDFSERLSPMLVKELRQGMRSPVFVWGLIVMNFFLAVVVWLTMLDPGDENLHQAFFGAYCVLVCGLLPLRAAGALHDELRGNTIDTLVLTRLNGWRITLGKWVAVVAQQWLAAITVLPYLIVRYFAGGLNVPMELAWLFIFLLAGMGSAAVLTGLSWIRYFLFRAAIMMGMTFATGAFCVVVLEDMYSYRKEYFLDDIWKEGTWRFFVFMLLPAVHLAFFCLDLGASKVGSMVESKAIRRRLVGVLVVLTYLVVGYSASGSFGGYARRSEFMFFVASFLTAVTIAVIGLQAILEKPVNLVSVVMPWVKRGWWGRLAGRFLYAGWPSGVCYFLGLLALAFALGMWRMQELAATTTRNDFNFSPRDIATAVAGFGGITAMLFVPLVLWRWLLSRRLPWHLGVYLLVLAGVVTIQFSIISIGSATGNQNLLKWGAPIPTMGLSWVMESEDRRDWRRAKLEDEIWLDWGFEKITLISGIVMQAWLVAAILCALKAFRQTSAVEQEALQGSLPQPRPEEPVPHV